EDVAPLDGEGDVVEGVDLGAPMAVGLGEVLDSDQRRAWVMWRDADIAANENARRTVSGRANDRCRVLIVADRSAGIGTWRMALVAGLRRAGPSTSLDESVFACCENDSRSRRRCQRRIAIW